MHLIQVRVTGLGLRVRKTDIVGFHPLEIQPLRGTAGAPGRATWAQMAADSPKNLRKFSEICKHEYYRKDA